MLSGNSSTNAQKSHKKQGYKPHKKYIIDLVNNQYFVI
ncbi:hypothetical protein D088_730063 [Salmonella enterica subsp. houtenae serovar 16:z4,z32:-- str. RKS3027]|nr:hypothetical protein D088_730063 [Salmonella enterica subsp. houtenae serovar 16:z4,z32:-- str. RKS3027]